MILHKFSRHDAWEQINNETTYPYNEEQTVLHNNHSITYFNIPL